MDVDDELCLCFHVSWRKVINYIRIERVRLPSQVAECQSAGTGCGWCRAAIRRLVEKVGQDQPDASDLEVWLNESYPKCKEYADGRLQHIAQGKGKPPS